MYDGGVLEVVGGYLGYIEYCGGIVEVFIRFGVGCSREGRGLLFSFAAVRVYVVVFGIGVRGYTGFIG